MISLTEKGNVFNEIPVDFIILGNHFFDNLSKGDSVNAPEERWFPGLDWGRSRSTIKQSQFSETFSNGNHPLEGVMNNDF